MAIIPMPTGGIRSIRWQFLQPSQVNRSAWTGRRQVVALPGAARWEASVELRPMLSDSDVSLWRGFLARLRGQQNTFRLRAVEQAQISGVTPLVNGGGQAGYTLSSDGWGSAGTKLLAGQMITIDDQLIPLGADVVANGAGQATLTLESKLRAPPADNATIIADWPTAIMALATDTIGWSVDPGRIYGFSFDCEEAF
jgi:hypothetical protein